MDATPDILLVRYGVIPEVARFSACASEAWQRGQRVVVRSHRGTELGTVLQVLSKSAKSAASANGAEENGTPSDDDLSVLRIASPDDEAEQRRLQDQCASEFSEWQRRISGWELELELIDLEWMLDRGKLVLYVLNDRGPDCTRLAIYASAEGLANLDVQPVDAGGLVHLEAGGGCGSGGCGSCDTH